MFAVSKRIKRGPSRRYQMQTKPQWKNRCLFRNTIRYDRNCAWYLFWVDGVIISLRRKRLCFFNYERDNQANLSLVILISFLMLMWGAK